MLISRRDYGTGGTPDLGAQDNEATRDQGKARQGAQEDPGSSESSKASSPAMPRPGKPHRERPGKGGGETGHLVNLGDKLNDSTLKSGRAKLTPKATETTTSRPSSARRILLPEPSAPPVDPEHELMQQLVNPMKDCSRQRLRAIQMGLRRYGNVESRITSKELNLVFQENGFKLTSRAFQMIVQKFEDHLGVDYEKIWRFLVRVQQSSGRDSVLAMNAKNLEDTANAMVIVPDVRDAELITRLEKQFLKSEFQPELAELRLTFQEKDRARGGQIARGEVIHICNENHLPIYGALLNSLLKRCDDEKNGKISWPEMMSFLDKSWQNLVQRYGDQIRMRPHRQPPSRPGSAIRPASTRPPSAVPSIARDVNETPPSSPKTSRQRVQSALKKKASMVTLAKEQNTEEIKDSPQTLHSETPANNGRPKSTYSTKSSDTAVSTSKVVPDVDLQNVPTPQPAKVAPPPQVITPPAEPQEKEQAPEKKKQPLKKSSSGTGFLKSVRSFLSGSKKSEAPAIPLIQVDRHMDIKEETSAELSANATPKLRPKQKFLKTTVRNKELKLWFPDDFNPADVKADPPIERLQLDWVYGYRGHDCRSNIHVMASGEVIYYVANTVVLYNVEEHRQRHYKEHTEEIKSMAVHADGVTVATGQSAPSQKKGGDGAHVRIWRSDSLQTLKILGSGYFEKSIICLAFPRPRPGDTGSDDTGGFPPNVEDRLVVVDKSKDHMMSVWNISKGLELAHMKLHTDVTCDVDINPKNPDVIVSIGKEHMMWWRYNAEKGLIETHAKPDYETHLKALYVTCLIHNDRGDVITGDSNGTIYVWGFPGSKILNMVKHAHSGPVFSLHLYRNALLSGGRDHMLKTWLCEKYMDSVGSLEIPETEGGIRMIQLHKGHLLLGTTTNTVLTVVINKQGPPLVGAELERPMTECHFDDLRGLMSLGDVTKPNLFMTAGYDGAICMFDAELKKSLWKAFIKGSHAMCADVTPDGNMVAIGTRDCQLLLLSITQHDSSDSGSAEEEKDSVTATPVGPDIHEMCRLKICNQKPSFVKISPDKEKIAVGSYDNSIYILTLEEVKVEGQPEQTDEGPKKEWMVTGTCKGHESFVNGIDWSKEPHKGSYLIRASDYGLECIVWDTKTCEKLEPEESRGVTWASHHCRVVYHLAGIWSTKIGKESEISAVCVSSDEKLVAIGDVRGYVGLCRHPCSKQAAFSHVYHGPVYVQDARFTHNGGYLLTTAGRDTCVMQWKVV